MDSYFIKKGSVLHNWHLTKKPLVIEGVDVSFNCVEQLFLILRFTHDKDVDNLILVHELLSLEDASIMRSLINSQVISSKVKSDPIWESIKRAAMLYSVHIRFAQDEKALELLLNTEQMELLYEDDDPVWGIGKNECCGNEMGVILTEVREFHNNLTKSKRKLTFSDIISMQTNRYYAFCRLEEKFLEVYENRLSRIKAVENMKKRENAKVLSVIKYGKREIVDCHHDEVDFNRFRNQSYELIPSIEYIYCEICGMSCILERSISNI